MSKSSTWCFTLNNYFEWLDPSLWPLVTYCVYQEEVSASGTEHLQGYIQFSSRRTLATVRSLDGLDGAHFEVARGSAQSNLDYCTKEDTRVGGPYFFGAINLKGQGNRTDLAALKDAVDDGASKRELYESHFETFSRCEKFVINYKRFRSVKRDWLMTVFLFVGTPGTGKTRTAVELASMLGEYYMVPATKGSGLYWDDYDGQTSIILDEMDGNRCTPTFLNSLCDRYPFEVPVHGSAGHQFCSKFIFICSNYMPKYWWKKHDISSFLRRVTCTWKFVYARAPRRAVRYDAHTGQFIHLLE